MQRKSNNEIKGMFVSRFSSFFISFEEIQKLDGSKSEKLKAYFYELFSFLLWSHPAANLKI
jgi:hypothetical protein